jgi:aconitate hydratase
MARLMPEGKVTSIYEAAVEYKARNTPLVIFAGKEYGTGSSRDWAAKGTMLLGVKAVIVESFERIHRSNLVGMGVLPLQFPEGTTRQTLKLDGSETVDISGIAGGIQPRMTIKMTVTRTSGEKFDVNLLCRIDTLDEVEYYRHGGILPYVLRGLLKAA